MPSVMLDGIECENLKEDRIFLHIKKDNVEFKIKKHSTGKYWTLWIRDEDEDKIKRYKSSNSTDYLLLIVGKFVKQLEAQKNGSQ
jgi:hypothetical protein